MSSVKSSKMVTCRNAFLAFRIASFSQFWHVIHQFCVENVQESVLRCRIYVEGHKETCSGPKVLLDVCDLIGFIKSLKGYIYWGIYGYGCDSNLRGERRDAITR